MRRWAVRNVMTRDVVFVGRDAGYKEIVELMLRHAVSAVPVIDAQGKVRGIVSELDLMQKVECTTTEEHPTIIERRRRRATWAKACADTAAELMTSPAIVINQDATVAAAAVLMHRKNVKRLPVVDHNGDLVGIISRADVLRGYLRPDAEIRREIVEDVLRHTLWVQPYEVEVTVRQGRVALTGRVDRQSTAQIAIQLVRATPGVVDVVARLAYPPANIVAARDAQSYAAAR